VHFSSYEILEEGPVRWKARLYGRDARCAYTQTISLEKGDCDIRFEVSMDWPDMQQGFLSCAIPTEGNDMLYGGIPFGAERRDVVGVKYGSPYGDGNSQWLDVHRAFDGLFYAKDFTMAVGTDFNAALYHIKGDRYYIYDKRSKELSYTLLNSATAIEGTWAQEVSKFSLHNAGPHTLNYVVGVYRNVEARPPLGAVARRGRQLRLPPVVCMPYRSLAPEKIPMTRSLLGCDAPNAAISAFYPRGDGYILRLWESAGIKTVANLTFPAEITGAEAQDFIGNPAGPDDPAFDVNKLTVGLDPWEIATIFITFTKGSVRKNVIPV